MHFLAQRLGMNIYLVQSATMYTRGKTPYGLLDVELVEDNGGGKGRTFYVEDQPEKVLEYQAGRTVFDEFNQLTKRRILVVKAPTFPIEELVGKRIVSP